MAVLETDDETDAETLLEAVDVSVLLTVLDSDADWVELTVLVPVPEADVLAVVVAVLDPELVLVDDAVTETVLETLEVTVELAVDETVIDTDVLAELDTELVAVVVVVVEDEVVDVVVVLVVHVSHFTGHVDCTTEARPGTAELMQSAGSSKIPPGAQMTSSVSPLHFPSLTSSCLLLRSSTPAPADPTRGSTHTGVSSRPRLASRMFPHCDNVASHAHCSTRL